MWKVLSKLYRTKIVAQWHQDQERKEFLTTEGIIFIITTLQDLF